jgi:hypothetical protein
LFMASTKRTGFINIYPEQKGLGSQRQRVHFGFGIFATQRDADINAETNRVAVATYEYEE